MSYRVPNIKMAVATSPWPLNPWPWQCHCYHRQTHATTNNHVRTAWLLYASGDQ